MNFLPLPREPIPYPYEAHIVPLYFSWPYKYEGTAFLQYLQYHPHTLFNDGGGPRQVEESTVKLHYQNWLFFGLLHEFLDDYFVEQDFVCWDADYQVNRLTTRKLPAILFRWREEKLALLMGTDPLYAHFNECLREAEWMLESTWRHFPDHGCELGLLVDVVAAVCEALTQTIVGAPYDDPDKKRSKPVWETFRWLEASYRLRHVERDLNHMRDHGGWCLAAAAQALQTFDTVEAWHYVRHLRLSDNCAEHQDCTYVNCTTTSSDHSLRIPLHTASSCRCASVFISNKRLSRIYGCGRIPCLRLRRRPNSTGGKPKIALDMVALSLGSTELTPYCALSHVWSDGTGNGHANSLPLCQISLLFEVLASWWDTQRNLDGKPILLWIDTMCCPYRQGSGKNLALQLMRRIYQHAVSVQIWDRSLLKWDFQSDGDYVEAAARLLFSPWAHRLWTAQEVIFSGVRPHGLGVVRFAHGSVPLTGLIRYPLTQASVCSSFATDLYDAMVWHSRQRWPGTGSGGKHRYAALETAAYMLHFRAASVAADEPLVLANIMGLGAEDFIGLAHEDAMCLFWKRIYEHEIWGIPGGIPKTAVFSTTPKLATGGYRWAPRTFMDAECQMSSSILYQLNHKRSPTADLTQTGLRARYRGFHVVPQLGTRYMCVYGNSLDACGKNFYRLALELQDGTWLAARMSLSHDSSFLQRFTKLFERLRAGRLTFIVNDGAIRLEPIKKAGCHLGHDKEVDGTIHASFDGCVGFEQMRENPVRLEVAARKCAQAFLELADQVLSSRKYPDTCKSGRVRLEELFDQHVRLYLRDNPGICDVVRSNCREDTHAKRDWTFEQVVEDDFKPRVHHQAHVGLFDVVELPPETMWCID